MKVAKEVPHDKQEIENTDANLGLGSLISPDLGRLALCPKRSLQAGAVPLIINQSS